MERFGSRDDEQPPICPACGVTMGLVIGEGGEARFACLECGFSDEDARRRERARFRAGIR
jgi:tRNA(Ile2) C34 agmatinyltransferase TiaS